MVYKIEEEKIQKKHEINKIQHCKFFFFNKIDIESQHHKTKGENCLQCW